MDAATIWKKTIKQLEGEFPRNNFNIWIKPTVGLKLDNNLLRIGVPHVYTKNMLEQRFYQQIKKAVDEIAGQTLKLEFTVFEKASPDEVDSGPLFSPAPPPAEQKTATEDRAEKLGLNSHFTFNTFIVGNSNNFAHAAAKAIVETPGRTYNPLFVYGGTGVGKTHLLHAIAHALTEKLSMENILCLSCEQFTNEIIASLNQGNIQKVRKKFRGADALLVDDVQFIAGKDFVQEEFFNTFNQLYLANKQIVISSDRTPREIPKLESRLVSRFLGGLTVDIQPPDYEMRVAIIKIKAKEMEVELSGEVIDLLASRIQTNVRELEGILSSTLTASRLNDREPTLEFVQSRLGMIDNQTRPLKPKDVLRVVANYFDIKLKDLTGKSRKAEYVFPRQLTMYLLRNEFRQPYEGVGEMIGGRDHTTVMYAVEKITKLVQEDPKTQKHFIQLKERLNQPLST